VLEGGSSWPGDGTCVVDHSTPTPAEPANWGRWRAPGPVLLSDEQRRTESLLAAAIAIEHARIVGADDARETAAYANAVLDNCRAQAADDLRRYLPLARKHLMWLRSLPAGHLFSSA
jgi:hypothetical protein